MTRRAVGFKSMRVGERVQGTENDSPCWRLPLSDKVPFAAPDAGIVRSSHTL